MFINRFASLGDGELSELHSGLRHIDAMIIQVQVDNW